MVRPLFPQRVSRCVWGRCPLPGPISLHQLLHIPRPLAALWRPVLLPKITCCSPAPKPAAHAREAAAGAGGGTAQWEGTGTASGGRRHGAAPALRLLSRAQIISAGKGNGEQGQPKEGPCARLLRVPARQAARRVLPGSRGAPVGGANPLAGVPHPSKQNSPLCMSNPVWQNHSRVLPVLVRAAAAWPGRAGCSWSPCLGADYSPLSLCSQTGLCAPPCSCL